MGRNRLPLLVGGTGQYVAAVLEGWQVPRVAPDPSLRARLEAEAERAGAQALHERLGSVDPQAADAIMSSNVRRVIRALEVYELTGRPISAQQRKQAPPFQACTLWLTLPSEVLYARIDQRVEAMMAAGLLDEVRSLVELGYSWELPAMSSLGYREFQPYFAGQATLDEAVQRLKFNTHAFARRQAAWFRRLPNLTRLAADTPDLFHVALRWWETCLRSADQAQRAGDDTPHRLRQP
ncbi:MAG TPA: tRNA (adenosine(37)-N6)-dimethylallyltransferase MiaA, partial [Roseiflexaceae bacterium]|nr:tRNA (adenosine(37)-N6)-dimethylallyltransferase MiaA [Roseiflexaceae bacterium]